MKYIKKFENLFSNPDGSALSTRDMKHTPNSRRQLTSKKPRGNKQDTLKAKYIGSCVDVGSDNDSPVCDIFPDATTMAMYVGNPDEGDPGESKELSRDEFMNLVDIPTRILSDNVSFHYISKGGISPNNASIFFIYNEDEDIHYFFRKY